MGFVNERLTPEQRGAFRKKAISYKSRSPLEPRHWTINKETSVVLIYVGVTSKDDPNEKVFYLECDDSSFFIEMCLETKSISSNEVWLRWSNFNLIDICNSQTDVNKIKKVVKESLKVYGLSGNPDPYFELANNSTYVFDF